MDKILVGLRVPVINRRFDLFVPVKTKIRILLTVLVDSVTELTDGRYPVSGEELLVLQNPDVLLDPECCLADYGVADGAQLVLI